MSESQRCPMTLTAGGPCPGALFDSGIHGMDQCSYCGTWVGRNESIPSFVMLHAGVGGDEGESKP